MESGSNSIKRKRKKTLIKDKIKQFYTTLSIGEWNRLIKSPYNRLEYDTTLHFLTKYLPPNGLVLDAGGGPGRYTIELAKRGYEVILLDLSPKLLDIARHEIKVAKVQKQVNEIVEGSFDDLSRFSTNHFDAILCCGALGHLLNRDARERAIDELIRVTKKNAPIFLSVIGRLHVPIAALVRYPQELEIDGLYQQVYETGDYSGGYGFTACHFYLPEELEASLQTRDVQIVERIGLEGLATFHQPETNTLFKNPRAWKNWWNLHLKTCTHPSVVGISEHFMIICRKRNQGNDY